MEDCNQCIFHHSLMDEGGHPIDICHKENNDLFCPKENRCDKFIQQSCLNCINHKKCLFETDFNPQSCCNYELKELDVSCHYCGYFNDSKKICERTGNPIPRNESVSEDINPLMVNCEKFSMFRKEVEIFRNAVTEFFRKVYRIYKDQNRSALNRVVSGEKFNVEKEKEALIKEIGELR